MASEQNCYGDATKLLSDYHEPNTEFLNYEKLNYEEERLKSFMTWPVHFPVDPTRLAKAGFYYTGIADEVVCFSCQGHVKNWNYGDIVFKKHADLYPNCAFIKNRSNNIPLSKISVKLNEQSFIIENISSISSNCSQSNSIDYNKMKSESERLKTFIGKWSLSFINISDLACAGFFYTGSDNEVQCPYCKGIISSWEIGSIPFEEHLKQFPWCDFLSETIAQEKRGPSCFHSSSQDVCGNMKKQASLSCNKLDNQQYTNLEDLGVHLHKDPIHPQQASLAARLRSFASWPSDALVSKEYLAVAGFFYVGIGDRTICFHCNGGLCSWEKGDEPWVEHARWFPKCDFLILNKGSDFINSYTVRNTLQMQNENYSQQSDRSVTAEPLLKKVDDAMKSNLVQYVLETELFPSYIVRAAILLQIKKTGNVFTNIDELCVAASYLKEEMEQQSFDVKPVQAEDLSISGNFSEACSISDASVIKDNKCAILPNSEKSHSDEKGLRNDHYEKLNSLQESDLKEQCICKICMDKEVGVVFLPCGHLPACTTCAPALKDCPMCRKSIQATLRVYLN